MLSIDFQSYPPRSWFFFILISNLAFRFWLSYAMPITGDEAYFIQWGQHPDLGFYDHPPMIGWVLAVLLQVSQAAWWLRLPIIVLPAVVAISIVLAFKQQFQEKAYWVAILFLLAPVNLWGVFITTDTPLIYCTFFSALLFVAARSKQSLLLHIAAGIFLGLAILSKYFAMLVVLIYCIAFALEKKPRQQITGFILMLATTVPFIAVNVYWNLNHCWANIMFNVFNRHDSAGFSIRTPIIYVLMLVYLVGPPLLYYFYLHRAKWRDVITEDRARLFFLLATVPFLFFGAISVVKLIGLHWVLSFYPFVFITLLFLWDVDTILKAARFMFWFGFLHIVAIVVTSVRPIEIWKETRLYDGIVFTLKINKIIDELQPYAAGYQFATDGYSPSAIISYYAKRHFIVFGEASSHARQDDLVTDFSKLNGKNILILRKTKPTMDQYQPYFKQVEFKEFTLLGVTFHIVLGSEFNYSVYRDRILRKVKEKYYNIPPYLPMKHCYFCDHYFPNEGCN